MGLDSTRSPFGQEQRRAYFVHASHPLLRIAIGMDAQEFSEAEPDASGHDPRWRACKCGLPMMHEHWAVAEALDR